MKSKVNQLADAYWAFETPWQEYRRKTADKRNASECGDPQIAAAAKTFLALFEEWQKDHPIRSEYFWGIDAQGYPIRMPKAA